MEVMVLSRADYLKMSEIYDNMTCRNSAMEASKIDKEYMESSGDPIFYGLPHTKQYPMPDEKHVRSAIRFFNYVSSEDEEELARNINKMIKKFNITDLNVGPTNRFKEYYKGTEESFMTNNAPIIPYGKRLTKPGLKPGVESSGPPDKANTGKSEPKFENVKFAEGMKLHPIFFTLTYHEAGFGKFIKFMTQAPYSHCVLFFDSSLQRGYSFAGREGHKMIPYGFTQESMQRWAQKNPNARYALYVMYLDDSDFNTVRNTVKNFYDRRTDFRYDVAGCVKTFFGIKNANNTKFFCSGFVAMCLSKTKGKHFTKSYDMYKPMDMPDAYGVHLVDMGIAGNYNQRYVDSQVKKIYIKNYASKIKNKGDKEEDSKPSETSNNQKEEPKQQETRKPEEDAGNTKMEG